MFLNLCTAWRRMDKIMLRRLRHQKTTHSYPWNRKLGGHQDLFEHFGERKFLSPSKYELIHNRGYNTVPMKQEAGRAPGPIWTFWRKEISPSKYELTHNRGYNFWKGSLLEVVGIPSKTGTVKWVLRFWSSEFLTLHCGLISKNSWLYFLLMLETHTFYF